MEFYSLILIMSIVVFAKKPDEETNCNRRIVNKYREDYKNYIKTVVGYIRLNIGLNEMQNLKFKKDSICTISIEEAFKPEINYNNFKNNYFYTINLLNFKYTEILKNFLDYIDIILQVCKQFHERNLEEKFICCVTSLIEEVKNSKTMFENLYNGMTFISNIDVRFVFQGCIMPNVIINEINFFQKYVLYKISESSQLDHNTHFNFNCLPNIEYSEMNFESLNEFLTVASIIVNNLFKNSNIIDTSIKTNSTTIQNNDDEFYLVYLTCSKLKSFYTENIEIWYKNLGFEKFLNPKIPILIPPIDSKFNINVAIKAFNILRHESGWKTMEHINIVYNEKLYSVDCIMKDSIDNINFQIKKEHVMQLLRCRYTEIIKNYHMLLTVLLTLCDNYAKHFNYNCLIKFFDSFNKSKIMFEGLQSALITLKKSLLWNITAMSHSNLQKILKWVDDFNCLLNNNEFSQDKFLDQKGIQITDIINKKVVVLLNFRKQFYIDLNSELGNMNSRCKMKDNFFDKTQLENYFKYLASKMSTSYYEHSIQMYHIACNYFDEFCENVYKSCYENLGFRKVNRLNKTSDEIIMVD
ncbi:uncharacterized protein LOC126895313 isoform X1 [Daktulosphaira vitifoliae]|uniref:uncharacterized protein LOC126895313 isoform X1 n=1 Tax=Daktulosphaira vitifoliae TaxID=58002 RepID=UPI0021AA26A7|nr:uncharacterized protein LOC126895313 isoform X1 [Daktulosphaira vitifoliae]